MVIKALCIAAIILTLSSAAVAERPNILLLVAEDMSLRVGAFGDNVAVTPHIDALADKGLRLPNAFTTAGVCAPSRASLITGMHQISIGGQHMRASNRPTGGYHAVPPPTVKAFPELLRAAGYYTFTDSKLDYQLSGTGSGSGPFTIWDDEGRNTSWRNRTPGQPFFGMINFMVTHESGTFDPLGTWPSSWMHALLQLYRAAGFGLRPDALAPPPESLELPPYYPDIPSVRRELARHYANIQAMDREVGEILADLAAEGLANNTIVIWTTDHGDGLPRAKRELYDSGIRVPMLIYWPERWRPADVAPGQLDKRLVSFVDLAPTILALAGIEQPAHMHGHDFLDPQATPRRYVYASRDRIDEVMDRQRAVRDERLKYIRSWYPQQAGGHPLAFRDIQAMTRDMRAMWLAGELNAEQARWFEPVGEEQLYDLRNDPHELNNLVDHPDYQQDLERLREALDNWLVAVGDWSEQLEDEMVENFLRNGKQCVTPPPQIHREGNKLMITSSTEGASLAYRRGKGDWQLYNGPFWVDDGVQIQARAVRYGWKASEVVSLN